MSYGMLGRLKSHLDSGNTPIAIYVKGILGVDVQNAMPTRLPGTIVDIDIGEGIVRFVVSGVGAPTFPGLNDRLLTIVVDEIVAFDRPNT